MNTSDRIASLRDDCVAMIETLADITRELSAAYEGGGDARENNLADAAEDLDLLRVSAAEACLEVRRAIESDRYDQSV
jgi:hypothetical protein